MAKGGGAVWHCLRQDSTTASCTKSWASASQLACCRAKSKSAGACRAIHCSQSDSAGNSCLEPLFTRFHLYKRHRQSFLSRIVWISFGDGIFDSTARTPLKIIGEY